MADNLIESLKRQFSGKRVLVVGLGLLGGGVGLVRFFYDLGAKVTATDLKTEKDLKDSLDKLKDLNIKLTLGSHQEKDFLEADYIFKGPSVPWDLPQLIKAQQQGITVDMEMSFFVRHCPAQIIGITGTRGKSTTTTIIYEVLKNNNLPVFIAGSLPQISTISLLGKLTQKDWVVLELPSWPLSGFHRFKISPHIAVFTNFYPDHLNFYPSMTDYLYDKKAIYLYQKENDYLVANKSLKEFIEKDKPKSKIIYYDAFDFPEKLKTLMGLHNQENAAAALKVAEILHIPLDRVMTTIANFKGIPFRQEILGEKDNVIFINDTTSTTPVATIKAVETFSSKPMVIILGGNSKRLPTEELINSLDRVTKIVLLKGSFTEEILPLLKIKYDDKITGSFGDIQEAVRVAFDQAKKISFEQKVKAYLIFSPGATSFAMFKNEFHRGEEYNKIVAQILSS